MCAIVQVNSTARTSRRSSTILR